MQSTTQLSKSEYYAKELSGIAYLLHGHIPTIARKVGVHKNTVLAYMNSVGPNQETYEAIYEVAKEILVNKVLQDEKNKAIAQRQYNHLLRIIENSSSLEISSYIIGENDVLEVSCTFERKGFESSGVIIIPEKIWGLSVENLGLAEYNISKSTFNVSGFEYGIHDFLEEHVDEYVARNLLVAYALRSVRPEDYMNSLIN